MLAATPYFVHISMNDHADAKLQAFSRLNAGWSYGRGMAFDSSVIANAAMLVQESTARGFFKLNVFPGLSGEVQVVIYRRKNAAEFTVEPDGNIWFCVEATGLEEPTQLTLQGALQQIAALQQEQGCDLYGSWILYTTTLNSDASKASPLGVTFPYLSLPAALPKAEEFVPISMSSIRPSREPLRYFGNFPHNLYRTVPV